MSLAPKMLLKASLGDFQQPREITNQLNVVGLPHTGEKILWFSRKKDIGYEVSFTFFGFAGSKWLYKDSEEMV